MKTCVFITGTNAVGKSSLAWNIIDHFGGVDKIDNGVTYCKDGAVSLAGRYVRRPWGGVDRLNCTRLLADVVAAGLKNSDTIICEGAFMDTFGLNLTNALFKDSQRQLYVSLYCDNKTLYERLVARSDGKNGRGRSLEKIFAKQARCMVAAKKYHTIGVPVLQIDTGKTAPAEILRLFLQKLNEIQSK